MSIINYEIVDKSWHETLEKAISKLNPDYMEFLERDEDYIPKKEKIFSAFTLPKSKTKYILFGESPYPREVSATGYAFIDGAVKSIFCETGLSKEVNKASSLRNFIKMLLLSKNYLSRDLSQIAISKIDKSDLITDIFELRDNFLNEGVLLLNANLILSSHKNRDKKEWQPFIKELLLNTPEVELILFGAFAKEIKSLQISNPYFEFEHPYNLSFIKNPNVLEFFKRFDLIEKRA